MEEILMDAGEVLREARAAAEKVRETPVTTRVKWIENLIQVVLSEMEPILDRLQAETGKSRSDALMSDLFPTLDFLRYLAKNSSRALSDQKVPTPLSLLGKSSKIVYEPLGVVLVISPWNYPFFQALGPCLAAFAAGNAVVYKPSEHTPLRGLCEDLFRKAGIPPDYIKIMYGDGSLAASLIEARPDKIFFTGSVATGKKIMAQAARQLIPVELELGGKDPMIVFEDVNIERTARGALWGAFTNAGQACTSVERLYVQRPIYEKFREVLLREAKKIRVEADKDGDAEYGRMTTASQIETVREHLEDALAGGAQLWSGAEWDRKSPFIPPLILDQVKPTMKIVYEETFGPVLPLIPFDTEEEAIRLANDSEYGLSASVWSHDLARAERVARKIKTGNVSINNVMLTEANSALPFGGVKSSGIGRFKGVVGFHAFCNQKSVLIDKDSKKIEVNWYPYTPEKYRGFACMMQGLFSGGIGGFLKFILSGLKLESLSQKPAPSVTPK